MSLTGIVKGICALEGIEYPVEVFKGSESRLGIWSEPYSGLFWSADIDTQNLAGGTRWKFV